MSKDQPIRTGTRSRILDAAEKLLQGVPSSQFKVADVAAEAGVSPSLVIQYFNTKDDLVFEATLQRMSRTVPEMYSRFASSGPDVDAWDYFRVALQRDLEQRHATVDLMSLSWRWDPTSEQRLRAVLAPRTDALKTLIARMPGGERFSPEDIARVAELANDLYLGVLRRACVAGRDSDAALAELRDLLEFVMPFSVDASARGAAAPRT